MTSERRSTCSYARKCPPVREARVAGETSRLTLAATERAGVLVDGDDVDADVLVRSDQQARDPVAIRSVEFDAVPPAQNVVAQVLAAGCGRAD